MLVQMLTVRQLPQLLRMGVRLMFDNSDSLERASTDVEFVPSRLRPRGLAYLFDIRPHHVVLCAVLHIWQSILAASTKCRTVLTHRRRCRYHYRIGCDAEHTRQ